MRNIMEETKRIVLSADLKSVKFYEKLGFKEDKGIQQLTKKHVIEEIDAVFLCWGFDDDEEEEELSSSFNTEDKEFRQSRR